MVSIKVVNEAKRELMGQKNQLINHLQTNDKNKLKDGANELSHYDNHPGEQGTELFEQEKEIALNEFSKQQLEEIDQALQAIEKETYGICEICGRAIQEERLLAVPATLRCQQHAKTKHMDDRPVEEKIINPDIIDRDVKSEATESAVFDGKDTWQAVEEHGSSETPSDFYKKHQSYDKMYIDSDDNAGNSEAIDEVAKTDLSGKSEENRQSQSKEDDEE